MSATTLPTLNPAESRALAGSALDTARRELIEAMHRLDATETRRPHRSAALAVDLIDDALAELAGEYAHYPEPRS